MQLSTIQKRGMNIICSDAMCKRMWQPQITQDGGDGNSVMRECFVRVTNKHFLCINLALKNKRVTMKKYKIGYTTGVFDLFHIGHLNILRRAKEQCEYLIVGVTVDELVSYKGVQPVVPYEERREIVENIRCVDKVVAQTSMNKMLAWYEHKFDVVFVGSDWQGTDKWNIIEAEFNKVGVSVIYLPYTHGTSSTKLRMVLQKINNGE